MKDLIRSPWVTDRPVWWRLVIALLCVAASTLAKAWLGEYLGARVPYVTFFPAVVIAALYGGLYGGLLATVLSGVAASYWIEPIGELAIANPTDWMAMVVFLVSGVLVACVCEVMHTAQLQLLTSERQARLAEEHERELLQRYELLSQNSRDIILFVRRHDGRIIEANEAALQAYGMDREELLALTIHDLHPSESRPETEARLNADDSADLQFETEHFRKDGSAFPVEISARGMSIGEDRILLEVVRDITKRKQAEETLRKSEAVLAQAAMMAHLGAWEVEILAPGRESANTRRWSDEVYRIFGYEPGSVTVTDSFFYEHVHPDDRDRVIECMAQAKELQEPYAVEHRIVRPDGSERTVAEYAQITYDGQGRPLRITGAVQDITEQKQLEDLLRQQADALHHADIAKDQFLAMLAHELRNPLGAIANAAALIEIQAEGQTRLKMPVEILNRQVRHTARLVDDLLDVSRITRGKFELRKEMVDVVGVVQRSVETARPQMDVRQHSFTVTLPAGPIWMDADPARLEQVVGNLLNNAAKYTDPGGSISLTLTSKDGEAEIRVQDNGNGIAPEMLTRIFDLFAQEDRSLDRSHGGLGIGLTLVKSLVELQGGSVAAQSEGPRHGSTFIVRLPVLEGPRMGTEPPTPVPSSRAWTILVVDDSVDTARAIADLLEVSGHRVYVAHDGPTAIEAAQKIRPDTVLLDIGLPGMDGYEVARSLRANAELAQAKLVALTGYGQEDDRRRSRNAGFDHHLVKPVEMASLLELLA